QRSRALVRFCKPGCHDHAVRPHWRRRTGTYCEPLTASCPGCRSMSIEAISREDLEEQLATVRVLAPGGAEGVFGPTSLTWLVDREAAIFLGAGRALLLQLAHPWIGQPRRPRGAVRADRASAADGYTGGERVDDRRVISGIVHVLRSCCR